MTLTINQKIYNAQCIGNIEPIEYMIPYPSMRSLIEGQNIKYGNQIVLKNNNITNFKFYELIQKTANWLTKQNIEPKERIILPKLKSPQSEILLYSIWQIGATAVLSKKIISNTIKNKYRIKELKLNNTLFSEINKFPNTFQPKYKPLLNEEALITFEKDYGIKLSHYNLLVNTNGLAKLINKKGRIRYSCNIDFYSSGWVILKAILPIYNGYIIDENNPQLTISNSNADFNIRYDIKNLNKFKKNDIAMFPENSGAIAIGKESIHLSKFLINTDSIQLEGHSVMMGYLDQKQNKNSFVNNSLIVPI